MVALMVAFAVVGLTDGADVGAVQFILLQPTVWFSALTFTHICFKTGVSEQFIHWQ